MKKRRAKRRNKRPGWKNLGKVMAENLRAKMNEDSIARNIFTVEPYWNSVDFIKEDKPLEKKRISSSHLALRFYLRDGWTEEVVKSFLIKGDIRKSAHFDEEEYHFRYYSFEVGSSFDVKKVLWHCSDLERYPGYKGNETDEEYLENFNKGFLI